MEFEQNGDDRAAYGSKLREKIAEKIAIKGLTAPSFPGAGSFTALIQRFLGY